jgi:hypothetical protein
VWSVQRLYNEDLLPLGESLETAMTRVGGWCEMAASMEVTQLEQSVVRQSPPSKDVNTETEEATVLGAATRR